LRKNKIFSLLAITALLLGLPTSIYADSKSEKENESTNKLSTPTGLSAAPTPGNAAISITVTFDTPVANAASYTVRLYDKEGERLIGQPRTNFTPGGTITSLTSDTSYRVSVQAIAATVNISSSKDREKNKRSQYTNSEESKKVVVKTAVAAAKVVITRASIGTARYVSFATQPQITIQDSRNNTFPTSAVVSASVSTGGTLTGTTTAQAVNGVATFTDLGVDGVFGSTYTITYSVLGFSVSAQVTLSTNYCDSFNGIWTAKTCDNNGSGMIISGNSVVIPTGYILNINGFTNAGTIFINGIISNSGIIDNNGTINISNNGLLSTVTHSTINNNSGGVINNSGQIQSNSVINNHNIINNISGLTDGVFLGSFGRVNNFCPYQWNGPQPTGYGLFSESDCFNITFIGNGLAAVADSSSLLGIPYGSNRTIYINEIDPVNWFLWYALDASGNEIQLNRTTSPISYTFTNVISNQSIELVFLNR